jgi:DhnA family fructose-bisphosphate aldolase class Ia
MPELAVASANQVPLFAAGGASPANAGAALSSRAAAMREKGGIGALSRR